MKSIASVASFLLLFAFSLQATNPAPFPGKFKVKTEVVGEKVVLTVVNLLKEKTIVSLKAINTAKPLYTEVIENHNGYKMALNLEEVPPGRYVLSVKKGKDYKQQIVRITSNVILLSEFSE